MKDIIEDAVPRDDVDRLVDAALAEPGRADDIKAILRTKIVAVGPVPVAASMTASDDDDPEDFWDNFPV